MVLPEYHSIGILKVFVLRSRRPVTGVEVVIGELVDEGTDVEKVSVING